MRNVLLLSAGRRVSLLRGFEDAARRYPDVRVYAADMTPELSAACRIAERAFALPRATDPDFAGALAETCRRNEIRLVVPTIDTELPVLAGFRESFRAQGVEIAVSARPLIDLFADKRSTAAFFVEKGLATPRLYARDSLAFPVFVKPYDGSLSKGAMLARTPEDLPPAAFADEKNLFCEYIDHATHAEYTCDLYFGADGRLKCAVPRKRLEVRGGEVSKAVTAKNDLVPLIFERFGALDGARGPLTLQLFRHEASGRAVFSEVNARFGGGYPLARRAGADFQAFLLREYVGGEDIATFHDWTDGMTMLRYDDEIIVSP